jgi:hypothetical protein
MNAAASSVSMHSPTRPGSEPTPEPGLTPEVALLLACGLEVSSSERARRVQSIVSGNFDWGKMLRLAQHHRMVPRLYQQLCSLHVVPSGFLEAFRPAYQANACQALWFTNELIRIVTRFESLGIQVVPYKGPTLAETLYGDVTMRQFSDLDLLVRPSQVSNAKAALLDLGYENNLRFTKQEERAYLRSGYEYTFNSAHGRNLIELKWQILPRFYSAQFDVDAMFQRAAPSSLGGCSLQTLCAEDLLLVLCVHATKHAWSQLSWLHDLGRLGKKPLDWSALERRCQDLGIERMVAVSLVLAQRVVAGRLPETVEKWVRTDRAIEHLANQIVPVLLLGAAYDPESIRYFRLMIKLRERWQDRVRFLWRLIFTPTSRDWSAIGLPARLFPLYHLVRMFRLAGKLLHPGRWIEHLPRCGTRAKPDAASLR